jgi:hypothetical protein
MVDCLHCYGELTQRAVQTLECFEAHNIMLAVPYFVILRKVAFIQATEGTKNEGPL